MTGAVGGRRLHRGEEGDARGAAGRTPAVKGRYLGTSNTICTGETAATRSTLQEEKRPVSSDMGAPGWRWGQREGHLHARQGVQAGQWVQVHLGLLAFLLPQQGQGVLEYQWVPGEGRDQEAASSEGPTGCHLAPGFPSPRRVSLQGSPGQTGRRAGTLTGSPLAPVSPLLPGAPGSPCTREEKGMRQDSGVHNWPGSFCSRRESHTGASAWGGLNSRGILTLLPLGPGGPLGPWGPEGPRAPGKPGAPAMPGAPCGRQKRLSSGAQGRGSGGGAPRGWL